MLKAFKFLSVVVMAAFLLSGCSLLEAKKKAGLQVITGDIPSSLFLDGQYLEKTPYINKEIQPGTYALRIQPDNPAYQPHEATVTLRRGLLTVVVWKPGTRPELSGGIIYEMEQLPNKNQTELSLLSIPDGAIITIDQLAKEFAPLTKTDLSPGEHTLTASLPSYDTQQHSLNLEPGHRVTVTLKLAKSAPETATPAAQTTSATSSATISSPPTPRPATQAATRAATASAATQPTLTGPRVKILPTNFRSNGQEVLRVRSTPGSGGAELGFALVGQEYPYTGQTSNGWHQITFNNQPGWVSAEFTQLFTQ